MAEEKQMQDQANLVEDGDLDGVSGGIIFKTPSVLKSFDPKHPWEVLDDKTGQPIPTKFATREQAEDYCTRHGLSTKHILGMHTVENARDAYQKYIESGGDPKNYKNTEWGRI